MMLLTTYEIISHDSFYSGLPFSGNNVYTKKQK